VDAEECPRCGDDPSAPHGGVSLRTLRRIEHEMRRALVYDYPDTPVSANRLRDWAGLLLVTRRALAYEAETPTGKD
jgi:hypothetical protein